MGEITLLLERARTGDAGSWEQLISLLYDDLLRLARRADHNRRMHTLNATALVNECYLRLSRRQAVAISNRGHFMALAGCAMRQILINYARERVAAKRGGGAVHIPLDALQLSADQEADELLMLDAALNQLAIEDEQLSHIVDCRIFAGLSEAETASALEIPLRTVQRRWKAARERLRDMLQS